MDERPEKKWFGRKAIAKGILSHIWENCPCETWSIANQRHPLLSWNFWDKFGVTCVDNGAVLWNIGPTKTYLFLLLAFSKLFGLLSFTFKIIYTEIISSSFCVLVFGMLSNKVKALYFMLYFMNIWQCETYSWNNLKPDSTLFTMASLTYRQKQQGDFSKGLCITLKFIIFPSPHAIIRFMQCVVNFGVQVVEVNEFTNFVDWLL